MKMYYDKDADLGVLKGRPVAIIGYGSQGHAHALNLRDSKVDVRVGVIKDPTREKARKAGLRVMDIDKAVRESEVMMMLVPDVPIMAEVYRKYVVPYIRPGSYLGFAHGFNIHYRQIVPDKWINVFMVAPKGPGHLVRNEYLRGAGVPCLIAVHNDPSGDTRDVALAYASGIGAGRAGIIETTFKDETETDLFGEQAVLCGGLTSLITAGWETLVNAGYPPELAYFECLHEVKLIVDLIYEGGISTMRYSISDTAKYGDITRGPKIIDARTRATMRKILKDIQSKKFAREWILENKRGRKNFTRLLKKGAEHPIEKIGTKLRAMMPWLKGKKLVDKSKN